MKPKQIREQVRDFAYEKLLLVFWNISRLQIDNNTIGDTHIVPRQIRDELFYQVQERYYEEVL